MQKLNFLKGKTVNYEEETSETGFVDVIPEEEMDGNF
jgi:hypothetical protein